MQNNVFEFNCGEAGKIFILSAMPVPRDGEWVVVSPKSAQASPHFGTTTLAREFKGIVERVVHVYSDCRDVQRIAVYLRRL